MSCKYGLTGQLKKYIRHNIIIQLFTNRGLSVRSFDAVSFFQGYHNPTAYDKKYAGN